MCRCLTPAPWALSAERREVPFRSALGTGAWRDELFERIAVWELWIAELGGRTFVEPPRAPRAGYEVILGYGTFLASCDVVLERHRQSGQ